MKPLFEFVRRINLRHWREHRLRTVLTAFGVTTGVALVVAVMVINTTMLSTATDTAERLAGNADIEVASADRTGLPGRTVGAVASVEGVEEAIPVMRNYTTAESSLDSRRFLVFGVTPSFPRLFQQEDAGGGFEIAGGFGTGRGLLLAADTARSLGVSVGEEVTVETPDGRVPLEVSGTFSGPSVKALGQDDVGAMFLPAAQEIFERQAVVDSVYVIADEGADKEKVERDIASVVEAGAIIGSPGERGEGYEDALNAIATLTSLAGTVALFVSAFVVFNTMSMSVAERRQEIAMSLALGATRHRVMMAFVGEAAVLGVIASSVGIGAGFVLAKAFAGPALDALRIFTLSPSGLIALEPAHLAIGLGSGMLVAMIGAYVPARRVMKMAPIHSLRPRGTSDDGASERRRVPRTLLGVGGVTLIVAGSAIGLLTARYLAQAAWITNAALFVLLIGATMLLPLVIPMAVRFLHRPLTRVMGVNARLAGAALLRNAGRTTITIGALVFTLGIVVAVGATLDSYKTRWRQFSEGWYAGPIHVTHDSYVSLGSDQFLPLRLRDVIERTRGVDEAHPVRYRVVNVDGRQTTIYAGSYEGLDEPSLSDEARERRERVVRSLSRDEIVISHFSARKKNLEVGDHLTVPTPSGEKSFKVGDVMYDLNPLDSLYMSEEVFLRHWPDKSVDRFEITVEPGASTDQVIHDLSAELNAEGIPARVMTKDGLIESTFELIQQTFSVAQGIQVAALLVAALAIANTMFMAILDRRWEIGLQRAVGMAGGSVTRSLLIEAGMIGLVGAAGAWLIGLLNGFLIVTDMELVLAFDIPFKVPWPLLGITLVTGSVIAMLAGMYPSKAAIRTPIVEALRFE